MNKQYPPECRRIAMAKMVVNAEISPLTIEPCSY
jgi:hypothetical protein